MQRIHSITSIAVAVALAGTAPFALAQTTPTSPMQHPQSGAITHQQPYQTTPMQDQQRLPPRIPQATRSSGQEMGQNDVTGTVKSISANCIVDVRTSVGLLRVHFPDASKSLKKGEKITLHLAFTEASPAASPTM